MFESRNDAEQLLDSGETEETLSSLSLWLNFLRPFL